MKLVIIESPLGTKPDGSRCVAEEMAENQRYARACMLDSLKRGEAPFASHVLYPLVLDDANGEERKLGMEAGFAWGMAAALVLAGREHLPAQWIARLSPDAGVAGVAAYVDRGVTTGMRKGINRHMNHGLPVEYRRLAGEWGPELWCVHVLGPDSLIAQPDKASAERRAAEYNEQFRRLLSRDPSPNDPVLRAEVEVWPWVPEAHAEGIAEHGGNPKEIC